MFDNSISADFTQNFNTVPWQKTFHTFGYLRFFAKAHSLHFAQNRLKANYRTHPSFLEIYSYISVASYKLRNMSKFIRGFLSYMSINFITGKMLSIVKLKHTTIRKSCLLRIVTTGVTTAYITKLSPTFQPTCYSKQKFAIINFSLKPIFHNHSLHKHFTNTIQNCTVNNNWLCNNCYRLILYILLL